MNPLSDVASKAERTATAIRNRILEAEASEGDFLGTKSDLTRDVGVAVGTLNEALTLLQVDGWITLKRGPGGGVFVADPPVTMRLGDSVIRFASGSMNVTDVMSVRRMLDNASAVEAASTIGDQGDVGDLLLPLSAMERAVDAEDATAFFLSNLEFHHEISRLTGNVVLIGIYDALTTILRRELPQVEVRNHVNNIGLHLRGRLDHHRAIAEAISTGDVGAAKRAADNHEVAVSPTANDPTTHLEKP